MVYVCQVPENVNVTVEGTNATVAWEGDAAEYVLKYKPYTGTAKVTLTAGNVFSDDTGYQMLLDADANAYGTIIPETGPLTSSGDASAATYAEFEYKIPENADGALTTSNIVVNNSITIEIPAGVYDWCITNPSPGDRMWIAGSNGNIGGRQDDYEFEADKIYEFVPALFGNNDGVDVTISEIDDEEEWTVIDGITENNYTIEGLTEGTQYIVEVQAICTDGGVSDWTDGEVFYIDIDGMNDYANGEIKVYPNPTKANVTIEAEGMSRVIVMNALGQVVYEANVTDNTVINMGQFGSGVYMVNITTSNGVTVKRVTVAK